jgi:TRAP-type mannitol/chloroaromatic compound transport system permease small subunit
MAMTDQEIQPLGAILKEIRDNQKLQLERQTEALVLQREQFALVQRQAERHERIQDRAENIQAKSAQIVAVARKTLFFLLPVVTLLIIYVSWLIFR